MTQSKTNTFRGPLLFIRQDVLTAFTLSTKDACVFVDTAEQAWQEWSSVVRWFGPLVATGELEVTNPIGAKITFVALP